MALLALLLGCGQRHPAAPAVLADVVLTPAQLAAPDPLQSALAACASCAVGDEDVDPGCGAAVAWASARAAALDRKGGVAAVAAVSRRHLGHVAPAVRMLAARAAALDLSANANAIVAQAVGESDARVLRALWSLVRGSPAKPAPPEVRAQAAARLAVDGAPAVQVAAVDVLDPVIDGAVLLAALATATEPARAAACEKLFAATPAVLAASVADPLRDPAIPISVRKACLVGAARAVCSMDQGVAQYATTAVLAALQTAPPWQLLSTLACAKGMSDEARLALATALRPVVDDPRAAGLSRSEAVRTLAALRAPAAWFAAWRKRYATAQFGDEGLVAAALHAVGR